MDIIPYNREFRNPARKLRRAGNLAEVLLWKELKKRKINGLQFLRQRPIHNYIVDFYSPELKLVIEVDGSSHDGKLQEDLFREHQLESFGIIFLRFTDSEVKNDIQTVVGVIKKFTASFAI